MLAVMWSCVQAEGLVLSLRDLFQAAFEMKKKEEEEKQEAEAGSNDVNSDVSGVETAEAGDEPSTVVSTHEHNDNNNQERYYSAVIMTKVIAKVHSVHLVNVEQRQAAADPHTKLPVLGCESACRQLSSTTTIAIYY